MQVIGLTGGIGSGKSTVSSIIKDYGIASIDLDVVSRLVVQKNSIGLRKIEQVFGCEFISNNGELNRAKLGELIFNNKTKKQQLENILHPLIRLETIKQLALLAKDNYAAIVEIPLLVEIGRPDYIDQVWVCDCTIETQIERVMHRDNKSRSEIETIIQQQSSRQQKIAIANKIINTDLDIEELKLFVRDLCIHLKLIS